MDRKPKTIFQLETPLPDVQWPKIPDKEQKLIFELLCQTLAPIGQRRANITASKGKRSAKRKRQEAKAKVLSDGSHEIREPDHRSPVLEIEKHIVVGLNSILRHLQILAQASKPRLPNATTTPETTPVDSEQLRPFTAIFALSPQPTHSALLTTHLPTLIAISSLAHPTQPPTRLIPLSQAQTLQLKTVLSLARVSQIGILDSAPGAEALIAVIRENVPEIEGRWLGGVGKANGVEFLETRINAIETFVGVSRKEMKVMEDGQ